MALLNDNEFKLNGQFFVPEVSREVSVNTSGAQQTSVILRYLSGKFAVVVWEATILHEMYCDGVGSHMIFSSFNVDLPVSLFSVCG